MTDINYIVDALKSTDILKEQYSAALDIKNKYSSNELTISVIGQFKRGKSSLINAILGEDILPVAIIPLTTVITEIRYGSSFKAVVLFNDGKETEITKDEIILYCSEQENSKNNKNVAVVKIWTPNHPFGNGIVLVDTPGVGSVHKHNTDSSYSYVKSSDAVIFLLSVDSPVSEIERDFLIDAKEYASKFYFAVNKADTASTEDLNTFIAFCSDVISGCMGTSINIKAVSARTKSGVKELTDLLIKDLSSSKNMLLEASVNKKLDIIRLQAKAKLGAAIVAAQLPEEELKAKLNGIEAKKDELYSLSEEILVLSRHRTDLLVAKIEDILNEKAKDLEAAAKAECESLYTKFQSLPFKDFEKSYKLELDSFMKTQLKAMNDSGLSVLKDGYSDIVNVLNNKALDAANFIAEFFKTEFNMDYPINETDFTVSEKSDFLMHIGAEGTLSLSSEDLIKFLPRSVANKRCYNNSIKIACNDINRNKNNMISNYRYKMQESLRTLCRELTDDVKSMSKDLDSIAVHINDNKNKAEKDSQLEIIHLNEILNKL